MVLLGIIIVILVIGFLVIRRRRSASEKQSVSLPSRDFDSLGSSCVASTRSLANGSLYQNEDYYSELPLESISQKSSVDDFTKKNISHIGIYSNLDPSDSLCRINVSESSYNSTNPSIKRKSKSSSRKSSTSKENVYEEIPFTRNALNNLKNMQNECDKRTHNETVLSSDANNSKNEVIFLPSTLESNSKPSTSVIDPAILALYAKVDFEKKRKSRISKNQNSPRGFESDKENATNSDLGTENYDALSKQPQSSIFNDSNTEESGKFDIALFRPRKRPPTPVKDTEYLENEGNHTNSANKQMSAAPCVFLDNTIYAGNNDNTTFMIENDLYSSA
ncbi:uncharacterized protein LOC143256013 [Tachypleus tridentatus]|uniref:uncharacterized protein LOC143256013 n=1 Tax=Tachypleus tridentatus TaxID=6853 RepID=UPI003FD0BE89